jgi:hypothetical protein
MWFEPKFRNGGCFSGATPELWSYVAVLSARHYGPHERRLFTGGGSGRWRAGRHYVPVAVRRARKKLERIRRRRGRLIR